MTRQIRTLTEKGMAAFKEKVEDFQKKLKIKSQNISEILSEEVSTDVSVVKLNRYEEKLKLGLEVYKSSVHTYSSFLDTTKTEESIELQHELRGIFEEQRYQVEEFLSLIHITKQQLLENLMKSVHVSPKPSSQDVLTDITSLSNRLLQN